MGSVSFVLAGDQIYFSPFIEKLVVALIVTGESRAEIIADNNSKTIIYISPNMTRGILEAYILVHIPPTYLTFPVKQHESELQIRFICLERGNCFYASLFSVLRSYHIFLNPICFVGICTPIILSWGCAAGTLRTLAYTRPC